MRKILTNGLVALFLILTSSVQAQQAIEVTGSVTDQGGLPLIGATITVKGTSRGTTTDFDGIYKINVNNNATLVFSYVGYVTKEIKVGDQTTINVVLQEDVSQLDEVVVVGFGTQKKENVSGATTFVKMDE